MPYLWQFSIIEFKERTLIKGVLLKSKPSFASNSILQHFFTVVGSYFKQVYANSSVLVEVGDTQLKTTSDAYGCFFLSVDELIDDHSEVRIRTADGALPLSLPSGYPYSFKYSMAEIDVISDIDDTIMISHTANDWKRISTLTMKRANKRQAIDFTKELLLFCEAQGSRIHYVSKSESNLFGLITRIIKLEELPKGVLFLTKYHKAVQLIKKIKAKNFKWDHISFVLGNSPDKQFILMGDDTQLDMQIYARVVENFPSRVKRIYIRKTRTVLKGKRQHMFNKLKTLFPKLVYFDDDEVWEDDLKDLEADFALN